MIRTLSKTEHKLSGTLDTADCFRILILYFIFLLSIGYSFGAGDMVELLPYARQLSDPSLYPQDFFIQHIIQYPINERVVFASLIALCQSSALLPYWCFAIHALSSIALIAAWYCIIRHYQFGKNQSALLIILCFVLLYGINLGGNELYYNFCVSSLSAKAICSWAFLAFLRRRNIAASLLLGVSVFIQPIVGLQLFLIFSGIIFIQLVQKRETPKSLLQFAFPFTVIAGFWIFQLYSNYAAQNIDKDLFLEIIRFRLPHHFLPSYFPIKSYLVLVPLAIIGCLCWFRNDIRIGFFFILAFCGTIIYAIGVEKFELTTLLSSQWFKIWIWLKPLSILGIALQLRNRGLPEKLQFLSKIEGKFYVILFILLCLRVPLSTQYFANNSAEIDCALAAKKLTARDAVFVIPASNSSFKYYSERSCYIDYKSMIHKQEVMPIWYQRIREVYKSDLANAGPAFGNVAIADQHLREISRTDLIKLRDLGVQYVMDFNTGNENQIPAIYSNDKYIIYDLSKL
ncbi:MAG: DUF6798 domain-containing protein [Saprospiraceae bacterium]